MPSDKSDTPDMIPSYLNGKMLIAMPGMGDPRFVRSLIFICAHSEEGAMGIVINKSVSGISFEELLRQMEILPETAPEGSVPDMQVHFGGPVEMARGFVLHSADYFSESATLPISDHVGLTATLDVLRAIAEGCGPAECLLALGYAGWAPGQLESEIQANGWLTCDADMGLIFGPDLEAKYDSALASLGIDPSLLSSEAGHA
ncbi:MAG: hypothetical protein C0605_02200 [Hyphomicrobiales bacterium]|nr:MAG: hypothetical protein C0605_02200 [Hyphomicrobiales bacterium]